MQGAGFWDVNYMLPALHHPLLLSYLYSFWEIKLALSFQSCSPEELNSSGKERTDQNGDI